ncbi:site-specific integrase [Streptomyces sp. RKAG293]|uniref:tyrosine-type recombinase/integrase n=1 Tax=Streptomyces sp. RKAG293 TaxID=2893403 RepID=UPI0020348365|nr:site-specific integrase [Streptomyces sp. RKAG293]MCM2416610.1 site-specific integrase [Streptomyces sp. RKAG293]
MKYNQDRALIAFYISTGARASELLGVPQGLVAPGDQTIGVVRKGSQVLQHLPASADAFVWLRLYQQELRGMVRKHPSEPLWGTLRRPFRPLEYDAARMVFTRANQLLGANWTLHDLRHSAAKRMVRDPNLTLADGQWVMGRAHISTTEIYMAPTPDEVVAHVLVHHERQRTVQAKPPAPLAPGYRPVHRPGCGPDPRQDPAAGPEQAVGLARRPARRDLARSADGQRGRRRWLRVD